MTTMRIELADEVAERVAAEAAARGLTPEELAGQVLAEQFPARRRLAFIGLGHSAGRPRSVTELRRELAKEKYQQMLDERRPAEG
jgi:hypothetical protein